MTSLIDSLSAKQCEKLNAALADAVMADLDLVDDFAEKTTPEIESPFVREWMPPEAVAHLRPSTVDQLLSDLAAIDFRWRLDAYEEVQSYIDALDGD